MYISLLYYLVYQYHPKWSTMKLMKLINPMILCYNSNFGTPKHWQNQHVSNNEYFNLLLLPPLRKKKYILQGTRKHDIPPNGNFEKIINSKGAGGSPRYPSGCIVTNHPLSTIPNSTWIHPRLGLPPHLASHVGWKGTHPVNAGTTPTPWSHAAWKGNETLPGTETRRELDSEKWQGENMVGVLKLGGGIWNQPMFF